VSCSVDKNCGFHFVFPAVVGEYKNCFKSFVHTFPTKNIEDVLRFVIEYEKTSGKRKRGAAMSIDHLQIQIINCGKDFECATLDALVRSTNPQHKTKYLQTLAANLDNDFKWYLAVATVSEEVVAWTCFFIDKSLAFHGLFSGILGKLYRVFPFKFKTAFIASPIAEYNMIHISDQYKPFESLIVDKLIDETLRFLKTEKLRLVIVKDHIHPYSSDYFNQKFVHLHFLPGTFIDLEGIHACEHMCRTECTGGCHCFDGYLMSLKKKWRANIRNKKNRRKDDLVIEVIDATNLSPEQNARCHELYHQTRNKQELKHECLGPSYFCTCSREFGESCKMLVAKVDENIIGFAQLLEAEDDVINVRMGMDYNYNKEYNLYYHLLYENISYCIRNKKKKLYTSQTCYRPKLEMGAKLLPLHSYVHFTNPLLHRFLGGAIAKNCACYSELIQTDRPSEVLSKHKLCNH